MTALCVSGDWRAANFYVYDSETGFYYLQSRYYDPTLGHFINADGLVSTGTGAIGYNMFAYCNNNPVMCVNSCGTRPIASTGVANESKEDRKTSCAFMGAIIRNELTYDTGAAEEYSYDDSISRNCYAYVLGAASAKFVGGYKGAVNDFDVNDVATMVIADADKDKRSIRQINSFYAPINSNEYRIALRTGEGDYNFMVQHSDGSWSHKLGELATVQEKVLNPYDINWYTEGYVRRRD